MSRSFWRLRSLRPYSGSSDFMVTAIVGILLLVFLTGGLAFFFSLRKYERTQVPLVVDREIVDALLELQERELVPYLRLRYSSDPALKGQVLDQRPSAGKIVRVGRRVDLTVSQGAVVDRVGDWRGASLIDVIDEIEALFTGYESLIQIGDVGYVFDDAPSGTVLEQDPRAGAEIVGQIELDLVVSRGRDVERIAMPALVGLDYREAIALLAERNIPFVIELDTYEEPGTILSQSPEAETLIPLNTTALLTMRPPENIPEGMLFGLFERILPTYPVAVEISLDSVRPDGSHHTIITMRHPGGQISMPYIEPDGSLLVLMRSGEEVLSLPAQAITDRTAEE